MIPHQKTIIKVAWKNYLFRAKNRSITEKPFITANSFNFLLLLVFTLFGVSFTAHSQQNQNTTLDENSNYYVNTQTLGRTPIGGDTIFVKSTRTFPLKFQQIEGDSLAPIVVINKGGQVKIDGVASNTWGALTFEDCKYIKVSGAGHPGYKYGFELSAVEAGLSFEELSSDCEAEFVKISHDGFFGIYAKKDYGGSPPTPIPVFENLIIHDCFIENVSEGMYLGETKTPGMEFKHVKIYNNIIRNTLRESIQIANMVEDVEIYNNTMINAGVEGVIYHMNNLQIGDNSVVNAYNNIIIGAPVFGIINMGKGNCSFTNNYIAASEGIFCDNRTVSDSLAPITIENNYIRAISGNQIIKNYNEMNYLTVQNNNYDTNITFFLNQSGNSNNYTVASNTLTTVTEIQFTDPANNDYSLASGTPTEYLSMGAPGGPEFFQYGDPATTPRQLVVTPEMVTDSVPGGSVFSPLLLFDEQSLDVLANEHAVSDPWKPDFAMNLSSYHAIVDFGYEHHISEIALHDASNVHNFTVEYYDGSTWVSLLVEPCDAFNVWKTHTTDVSTRYLRFSMYDSPYAAINEIIIQGYPLVKNSQQIAITSGMVTDMVSGGSVDSPLLLFDEQSLDVAANQHAVSSSWKPAYTDANAPYHAMIDLGQDHHISEINMHDMSGVHDFVIEYGDGANWVPLFTEPCDAFNVWKTHGTDIATRYLRLKMPLSTYAAVNEIIISGYAIMTLPGTNVVPSDPVPQSQQIVVTSSMVTDWVSGGSVNSPDLLFDQQNVDISTNEHPTGDSWQPDYTSTNAPYYATIDLGQDHHISEVIMHDMSSVYDFNVEYADGANWISLLVEPCDNFNTWKTHEEDVTTRYLRFTMLQSPYAAINEIVLYGYPIANSSKQSKKKSTAMPPVNGATVMPLEKIELYTNPVNKGLYVLFPESMVGNNHIRIIDELGKVVYSKGVVVSKEAAKIELNDASILSASGFFILSCTNDIGEHQTIKFFKE